MRSLPTSGKIIAYPTEHEMRRFMLEAAAQFRNLTGMPGYEVSARAMRDASFLRHIANGRPFYAHTFEKFMSWIDENLEMYLRTQTEVTDAKQSPRSKLSQAD